MDYNNIVQWIIALVSGGGLGTVITYILTFKSKKKLLEAEAESLVIDVLLKKLDLKQDLYDFLLKTCDKYIKDYHELETDFRKKISELREQMDKIMLEKSKAISTKCNEIAALKSEITYLKGLRCYNFTCLKRLKVNPDKK